MNEYSLAKVQLRYNKKRDYSLFICEVRQKMSIFANEIIKMR